MTTKSSKPDRSTRLPRPSLFFMILASIALLVFGGAMIHLASLHAPDRERLKLEQERKRIGMESAAERAGMNVEDHQKLVNSKAKLREDAFEINSKLIVAISERDDKEVVVAARAYVKFIADESRQDDYQRYGSILSESIKKEYPAGLKALLEAGIECAFSSKSGSQAYLQAAGVLDDVYMKMLIDFPCSFDGVKHNKTLLDYLAQSQYPQRIALLPDSDVSNDEQRDGAFLLVMARGRSEQALAMLEAGANPNAVATKRQGPPLYLALRYKMPQVPLALLEKGADPIAIYNEIQTMLSAAIQYEQVEVVREILKRVPEYVTSSDIGDPAIATALNLKDVTLRKQFVELLFEHGATTPKNLQVHYRWLDVAIKNQDIALLNLFLQNGVNPRVVSGQRTPLGNAKQLLSLNSEGSDSGKTQKIIELLLQHNATDDILELLREERNVAYDPNCKMGKPISVKPSEQAMAFLKQYSQLADGETRPASAPDRVVSRQCSTTIFDCVNQGFGFDDCALSAPSCSSANESLCCTQSSRDYIFQLRCSGLDVRETMSLMGRS